MIRNKKFTGLTNILDTSNEKIIEVEDLTIDTIQNEAEREQKAKK